MAPVSLEIEPCQGAPRLGFAGESRRPGRLLPAGSLLLIAVLWASCGLRTAPQPVSRKLPTTLGLAVRQQERHAVVAWRMPAGELAEKFGGLNGFALIIARVPADCRACPPESVGRVALEMDSVALRVEAGRAYYRFPLPPGPTAWRIRVATQFGMGRTVFSRAALLEVISEVPRHGLAWKFLYARKGAASSGSREPSGVVLYWLPRRERMVRVITKSGVMVEREKQYRANLYRRSPDQPWPLTPLNPAPLQVRQWKMGGRYVTGRARRESLEFALRLVDQFGNEGPKSPPVTLTLAPALTPASGKP